MGDMSNPNQSSLITETVTGKRRNRKGAETRQRVLEAAVNCLQKFGYANTSIESVMSEAGLSRGSVLNQFPTRLDLMSAAASAAMMAMVNDSWRRIEAIQGAAQRLEQHVDVIWQSQNMPEAAAVTEVLLAARWDHELAARLKPVAEYVEADIDSLVEQVAIDAGIENVVEYQLHVRVLILSLRGLTLENMYDDNRDIMRRALDRIRQMHHRVCARLLGQI